MPRDPTAPARPSTSTQGCPTDPEVACRRQRQTAKGRFFDAKQTYSKGLGTVILVIGHFADAIRSRGRWRLNELCSAALAALACFWVPACVSSAAIHVGAHDGGGETGCADSLSGVEGGAAGFVDGSPDTQTCGTRVPADHRAMEGPPCPSDRAPGGGIPPRCVFDGGPSDLGKCRQDSDCTAGINGRCFEHGDCYMMCSYDECFQDSDCPGNVPCGCRDSASSTANNWCLVGSNCRVDDDCGPCGYCSPSQLSGCVRMCTVPCDTGTHCYAGTTEVPCSCSRGCGTGYFCHTADDTCTNDRECTGDSACTRQLSGDWACMPCAGVP